MRPLFAFSFGEETKRSTVQSSMKTRPLVRQPAQRRTSSTNEHFHSVFEVFSLCLLCTLSSLYTLWVRVSNTYIPCYLISSLSAWMNPVIYNYINRSFRREFYALYPCCCRLPSSRFSAAALSRTEMPSTIVRNSHRQGLRSIPEDPSSLFAPSSNRSSTRYVTFAERRNERVNTTRSD